MKLHATAILIASAILAGCNPHDTELTGKACLGPNNDTLVETLKDSCKAGDTVATKHPAYFCDFTYSVAYNDFNSAMCVYNGKQREERFADPAK